ncbi:MAG: DMT family transporter [Candidatus Zixiibacteriota bacterium]
MTSHRTGDLYALACAVVCGLGNIPAKVAVENITVEIYNVFFFTFAFIFSNYVWFSKKEREEVRSINVSTLGLIFILALIFTAALYLFITSLKLIEPATVSFLSRFEVILTVVLAYLLLRERLRAFEIIGGLIALVGILVLKYKTNLVISKAATLMVMSSLLFAFAEIIVKKYIAILGTGKFLFFRNFFMIFIALGILYARGQTVYFPPTKTILLILAAAIMLPVLGRATYMEALKRINLSRAALVTQSTPLFNALFAFVILSSMPSLTEWLGGGLIIGGVVIIQLFAGKEKKGGVEPL